MRWSLASTIPVVLACAHSPAGPRGAAVSGDMVGCYRVVSFDAGATRIPRPPELIELTADDYLNAAPPNRHELVKELLDMRHAQGARVVKPAFRVYGREQVLYWQVTPEGTLRIVTASVPTALSYSLRVTPEGDLEGVGEFPVDVVPCLSCAFERETVLRLARVDCAAARPTAVEGKSPMLPPSELVEPGCRARADDAPPPPAFAEYPPELAAAGIEGSVGLRIEVTRSGMVRCVHIDKSSGYPQLDAAAVVNVAHMKFKPAMTNGEAVDAVVSYTYRFRVAEDGENWNSPSEPATSTP